MLGLNYIGCSICKVSDTQGDLLIIRNQASLLTKIKVAQRKINYFHGILLHSSKAYQVSLHICPQEQVMESRS